MEKVSTKVIHDEVLNIYAKYIAQMIMYCESNSSNKNQEILNNLVKLGATNSSTYIKLGGVPNITSGIIEIYKKNMNSIKK